MTVTSNPPAAPAAPVDLVTLTIDDVELSVPKGTLVIRAAEQIGIVIPRFCDHPLLAPAGACRQCLVEVATQGPDGSMRAMPKPQASCTLEVSPGMVVRTQYSSPVAEKAQRGIMEFLLINHPLDCPVCDKGGECPLQNQAMANGQGETRFTETKRTFPKPIRISTQVLLDRERCILCQRCTRFSKEIAGDPFIDLQMRGAQQQIGTFSPGVLDFHTQLREVVPATNPELEPRPETDLQGVPEDESRGASGDPATTHLTGSYASDALAGGRSTIGDSLMDESGQPFASYFSGNTVQICPVGALTGAAYRFRSRPYDLESAPSVCEHCASGCALRVDHRRGVVLRRLAGDDPAVNEEWNCDKGRWAFQWGTGADRVTSPLVRGEDGALHAVSWPEALRVAGQGLAGASAGVLPGGRVTVEDAYGYAKFARVALRTNDVDHRARPHSAEEAAFLAHAVAGQGLGVTYADLEAAPVVLLAGLEPEEESPIVFLRLRKAVQAGRGRVFAVAPWASRGLTKLGGELLAAAPSTEAEVLTALRHEHEQVEHDHAGHEQLASAAAALAEPGAVILVGERLATSPAALSGALALARATGARLAWVPRRAGERGALEAGLLPGLLPGGRPVADPQARVDVGAVWDGVSLPAAPGRDLTGMLTAAAAGELDALVVGGVDLSDLPDPELARRALEKAFVVCLEVRAGSATALADVVLPVAPANEKAGTFLDWEGRWRSFPAALATDALSDYRVLDALADEMGVVLRLRTVHAVRSELAELESWAGPATQPPQERAGDPPQVGPGQAVLASWPLLLDAGRLQDGEPYLAGTAHRAVARMSAGTASRIGAVDGQDVVVATGRGSITAPLLVTDMPDDVVWLPTNSARCAVRSTLGADNGAVVSISRGER